MCLRVFPSASLVCVWKSLERRSRPSCQTRKIWAIITIILPAAKELCKSPPDQSLSLSLCAAERQRGEGNGTFPIGENIIKGGKKNKNKSTHSRWRGSRRRCEREREATARIISDWPVWAHLMKMIPYGVRPQTERWVYNCRDGCIRHYNTVQQLSSYTAQSICSLCVWGGVIGIYILNIKASVSTKAIKTCRREFNKSDQQEAAREIWQSVIIRLESQAGRYKTTNSFTSTLLK